MFENGERVRVIANPGRIGFLTGKSLQRGGRNLLQIRFPDNTQYLAEEELEIVSKGKQHPLDLLMEGKIGRGADLRRLLTHIKLSGRLANLLYSMEVSNTDFYAHQFKPVLKILNSVGNGILIADEVGLGKTIEAGLIWTELKSRFDYSRLMVLCPAFLREKWQRELKTRFGVKAEIQDARGVYEKLKSISETQTTEPFAIIGSMQGLRPQRGWDEDESEDERPTTLLSRLLQSNQHSDPLIDLLIIDEAHYLRLSDLKRTDKKTAVLGRLLRDVSEHVVLLSATPVHLRSHDLYQLLNIVDEATFNEPHVFDDILFANAPLVRARELIINRNPNIEEFRSQIIAALNNPLLDGNRQLSALLDNLPDQNDLANPRNRAELAYKLETINLLGHVITRTRKREVTEHRVLRQVVPQFVKLSPEEQLFYETVTDTVREFCERHGRQEGFILSTPQRQMSSSMPAALRYWQSRAAIDPEELFEDLGLDIEETKRGPIIDELIGKIKKFGDLDNLWKNDSKFLHLVSLVKGYLAEKPNEKIVLFSYFRATLDYLHERLGIEGVSSIVLKGGGQISKDDVIRQFEKQGGPTILLSSEVGSEGIDLQFARVLINYDLPWNPMKVEQRIGRIDRLGQKAESIIVWNLFCENTIDARIYFKLFTRLKIFESALGGFEAILGEEIQKLTLDLLLRKLTPEEEEARIEQTAQAIQYVKINEEELENEAAHLVAYGDYIINQVKAARELHRWVSGNDIKTYVLDYFKLHYQGCEFRQTSEDIYNVYLSNEAKLDLQHFIRANRFEVRTFLTKSDSLPVKCQFVNRLSVTEKKNFEVINQSHPLVRFVSAQLNEQEDQYYPFVSLLVSREVLDCNVEPGLYVFAIQHWSVDGLQEIERLCYASASYASETVINDEVAEKLITTAATESSDWLEGRSQFDVEKILKIANEVCLFQSDEKYASWVTDLRNQNEDRADLQVRTLEMHLSNQVNKYTAIKEKHMRLGRSSLSKATEGRIFALQNRFERKVLEIQKRRKIHSDKTEICIGVINIK